MKELLNFSIAKLKRIVVLKAKIGRLQMQLEGLATSGSPTPGKKVVQKRRKMSAAARKKISLAATARWAKVRAAAKKK
ncbi:MAG TPA: hypothetical protein VII71_01015 [Verrucomicrobiae bacterium]|jgi:hypothetical protein